VILDCIKSLSLTVDARASNMKGASVDVPVIQEIVGGNVKVNAAGTSASKVTYEGATPLVLGFQAARMEYVDGKYAGMSMVRVGKGQMLAPGAGKPVLAKTTTLFARIDDPR
jgi:hypothetical protein